MFIPNISCYVWRAYGAEANQEIITFACVTHVRWQSVSNWIVVTAAAAAATATHHDTIEKGSQTSDLIPSNLWSFSLMSSYFVQFHSVEFIDGHDVDDYYRYYYSASGTRSLRITNNVVFFTAIQLTINFGNFLKSIIHFVVIPTHCYHHQ